MRVGGWGACPGNNESDGPGHGGALTGKEPISSNHHPTGPTLERREPMAASAAMPRTIEQENKASFWRLVRLSRHAIRHVHAEQKWRMNPRRTLVSLAVMGAVRGHPPERILPPLRRSE